MATDSLPNVAKLNPELSKKKLFELLDKAHDRLLAVVTFAKACSETDPEFPSEAFGEIAHIIDDIAGDMFPFVHDYRQRQEGVEA